MSSGYYFVDKFTLSDGTSIEIPTNANEREKAFKSLMQKYNGNNKLIREIKRIKERYDVKEFIRGGKIIKKHKSKKSMRKSKKPHKKNNKKNKTIKRK
jgi:hypothetical protein